MGASINKMELTLDINISKTRTGGKSETYGLGDFATFTPEAIDIGRTIANARRNTLPDDCTIVSARLKSQQIQRYEHELLPSPLVGAFTNVIAGFVSGDKITYTTPAGVLAFQASDMLSVDNPDSAWFFRAQHATGARRWFHFNGVVDLFQQEFDIKTTADPEQWTNPLLELATGDAPAADKGLTENFKRLLKYVKDTCVMYRPLSGYGLAQVWQDTPIGEIYFKYCSKSECGAPFQRLHGKA